jgi:hypothetical protein
MGSDGLEPSPARVRTECAAANTLIPRCLLFRRSARRESNPRRALIRSLLSPLSYEPFVSEPNIPVGPEGIEPSPARLKVCCAAVTPRPRNRSEAGVSIVVSSFRVSFRQRGVARGGVEPPLPPYQSDMLPLQHRAANRGGGNRTRCYVRPRHVGHHYPSPRSSFSSSSGNRTPSSALKGQYPGPVDERAVRARFARGGSGGARIHVSRSSAWR